MYQLDELTSQGCRLGSSNRLGVLVLYFITVGISCQANQASATSEECTVAWGICNVSEGWLLVCAPLSFQKVGFNRMFLQRTIACFPFSLHLSLAQDSTSLPIGQQGVGIPKVRTIVDFTVATCTWEIWEIKYYPLHKEFAHALAYGASWSSRRRFRRQDGFWG